MPGRPELPPDPKPPTDAKKQWIKEVIKAAGTYQVVVQRFEHAVASRRAAGETARKAGFGRPEAKFKQNQPPGLDIIRPVDTTLLPDDTWQALIFLLQEDSHQVLKLTHSAIAKRLNSHGIVLTVLASVSFVAILQPPGSFDNNGNMRSPVLVGCFVFLSTLSFLFACTGLFAVVVGVASLFRPAFFLKFETTLSSTSNSEPSSHHSTRGSGSGKSSPSQLLWNAEDMDNLSVLALLLWDNLERVWRLRIYLIVALV